MDRPDFDRFGGFIAAFVIGIICNALGLYGAIKFKKTFVMVAAVWFGIEAILSLVLFMDFAGATIALCFLYPQIMLFRDMQKGIITPETFPNEKDCCGSFC
jgi:Flp pilus assembly protein protease CpaA